MIKAISKRMLRLIFLCGAVGALLLGVFLVLKNGIHISSLRVGKLQISRLYLKLDNKFVLHVGQLDISALLNHQPKKPPPSVDNIVQGVRYALLALSYFQELQVQEIVINPRAKIHVRFDGKTYRVRWPGVLDSQFSLANDKDLRLEVWHCQLNPYHVRAKGHVRYSSIARQLSFALEASPLNDLASLRPSHLQARIHGLSDFNTLNLDLSTNEITHLDFLKPYFPEGSHPVVQKWLFENIEFSSVRVLEAKALLHLKDKQLLKNLLDQISARALVKDARVLFAPTLSPIVAKEVALDLQKRTLSITPKHIRYENMPLEHSSVQIRNLGKGSYLSADIKIAPSPSFKSALKILQAYHITPPISKLTSLLSADLLLGVQFIPHASPLISIQGDVLVHPGNFLLYGYPFSSQQATLTLDITPKYRQMWINATHTRYYNIADLNVNMNLDFTQKHLLGSVDVNKIQLSTNNAINTQPFSPTRSVFKAPSSAPNIAHLPNLLAQSKSILEQRIQALIRAQNQERFTQDIIYATPDTLPSIDFDLDFSAEQDWRFHSANLDIQGSLQKGMYALKLQDLKKLLPISPLLRYFGIKKGALHLNTKDFKRVEFVGSVENRLPLYRRDGTPLKTLSFLGTFKPESVEFFTPDGSIMGQIKGGQRAFFFNDINFNLDAFLNSKIPFIKELLTPAKHKPTKAQIRDESAFIRAKQDYEKRHNIFPNSTIISAKNTAILFKSFPLVLDNARLVVRDGRVMIDGAYHNAMLRADIIHGDVIVKADNFGGDYLNLALQSVLSANVIGGGLYSLTGVYRDQVFNGELRMQNTSIKNFKVLQNIVNIINTIPSLIVFRNPRLGAHGYEIAKGRVVFGLSSEYLGLEHIQLTGTTLDVDGDGIIEMAGKKKIDMSLDISTIKAFSNVINKIPILNYLILGNKGKISTHVQVGNTLNDPSVKVTLAKDIAQAPFKILRRIFTPIDIIVQEIKKGLAPHDSARLPEEPTLHHPRDQRH
ncbi:YhdP family protein [Helicobacter labacensis]|uniref:YhdP family protein n=1 Tax=Helicobacter labacensis TaxID=2316079 RepID=UPI000EB3FEB2|nr:AsmA-like C-terminal domain-containing protein [Helicobacter labacensis]